MKSNLKCNNCSFFRSFGGDVFIQFGLQQSGQIASSMPLPTRASRKPGRFFFSDENRKLFQTQRNDKRWKCLNVSHATDRRIRVGGCQHDATPSIVKFIYNSSKTFYLPFYFVQRFDVASFFSLHFNLFFGNRFSSSYILLSCNCCRGFGAFSLLKMLDFSSFVFIIFGVIAISRRTVTRHVPLVASIFHGTIPFSRSYRPHQHLQSVWKWNVRSACVRSCMSVVCWNDDRVKTNR